MPRRFPRSLAASAALALLAAAAPLACSSPRVGVAPAPRSAAGGSSADSLLDVRADSAVEAQRDSNALPVTGGPDTTRADTSRVR